MEVFTLFLESNDNNYERIVAISHDKKRLDRIAKDINRIRNLCDIYDISTKAELNGEDKYPEARVDKTNILSDGDAFEWFDLLKDFYTRLKNNLLDEKEANPLLPNELMVDWNNWMS